MELLDYLEGIIDLATVEDVWSLHLDTMSKFGFDRLLYAFTRSRTAHSFGDKNDILLLTNHNQDYIHAFVDGGMYFHAPMVKWAAENVGAHPWTWMSQDVRELTEVETKIRDFNRRNAITAGYTVSFKDISVRAKGAIGLVARNGLSQQDADAIWAEHGRTIIQMNNVAHLKIASLPFAPPNRRLTTRQREALEWVGDGKTIQDIATIMGLTPATIEKHLRLARQALDVETTAQAVLKASFNNQIFVIGN